MRGNAATGVCAAGKLDRRVAIAPRGLALFNRTLLGIPSHE